MTRLVTFVFVLTAGSCCLIAMSKKSPPKPANKAEVLTVFLTGNELGTLKPCGCSGGQLGGFDRRSPVLKNAAAKRRLIVDTGSFVEGDSEQDLIKFNIIIQAFRLLGYDLVNLTEKDIQRVEDIGLLDSIGSVLNVISAHGPTDVNMPAKFTKQLLLKEKVVTVTVAAFDVKSGKMEQISRLFPQAPDRQTVNILIVNQRDTATVNSVSKMGIVSCLVVPSESDEARVVGDPKKRPLVVSVGRYGRYVGKLQIRDDEAGDTLKLSFSPVDVNENLPRDKTLVGLYKDYQQFVKEAHLLEKYPRFALPGGLEYVGSEACKLCHSYEYEKWSTRAHADAYATLEKVGSQFDPECVVCHVVGMKYESGFVSEQKTGHLKNVGCENCHGPGSEHIRGLGEIKTTGPRSDCTDCHTPETSGEYLANEDLYFEKIIHWKEPNAAGNVK